MGEVAATLYPSSAFYFANVVLELVLNSICGLLYAVIMFTLLKYWALAGSAEEVVSLDLIQRRLLVQIRWSILLPSLVIQPH